MLKLTYNTKDTDSYLVPMGDFHIGDNNFAEEKLVDYVNWIKAHENAYTILMGDIFETPEKLSKASDLWELCMKPEDCVNKAVEVLTPIASRILGVVHGNHEDRMYKKFGTTQLNELLPRLGITNKIMSHDALILNWRVGEITYVVYALHGWGGARLTGGQLNKSEQMGDVVRDADVFLTGHEHTLFMSRWDSDLIKDDMELRQVHVGCGCFCRYTKFQEGIARRKPNVGAPRIRFNGSRRDVHVSI